MKRVLAIAIVLVALFSINMAPNFSARNRSSVNVDIFPPAENITFGIYTGGTQEIPRDNFSILISEIKGYGFNVKNVTNLQSMADVEGIDVLVLLTQKDVSESEREIIKNYTLMGGSIFYVLPQEITDDVKDTLKIFGWETLDMVKDNESFYEKESYVVLNGSWPNITVMGRLNSLLVVNATALNYTGEIPLLKELRLNETFRIDNETEVSVVYNNKLVWGMNTTFTEYKKGKKLYGENVTIGFVQEYWFGGRMVVISSAYMFEDTYIIMKKYDNLMFLDNLILWLGHHLSYIGIEIIERDPSQTRINIDENPEIYIKFVLRITNTTMGTSNDSLVVLVGLEYLGELKYVESPEPMKYTYDNKSSIATYTFEVNMSISQILNKSAVVFLRIMAAKPFYGFHWNKAIRIEAEKPLYKPVKFHISLLFIVAIVAINLVFAVIIMSYAFARRKEAKLPI